MEEINKIKTEDLERRIADRISQIKRIVGFIDKLTHEVGEVISRNRGSAHTNVISIVKGFKDFTFLADVGHNMFGGNDFHVWYHPDRKEINTENDPQVFSVYYQVSIEEESEVIVFDPDPKWLAVLDEMIDRQEEVIAEVKKQKESRKMQKKIQYEDDEKRGRLLERAKKLKL